MFALLLAMAPVPEIVLPAETACIPGEHCPAGSAVMPPEALSVKEEMIAELRKTSDHLEALLLPRQYLTFDDLQRKRADVLFSGRGLLLRHCIDVNFRSLARSTEPANAVALATMAECVEEDSAIRRALFFVYGMVRSPRERGKMADEDADRLHAGLIEAVTSRVMRQRAHRP